MKHNEIIQDEWKNIAPKLSGIKKENPFDVPVGYFEALPDKVKKRISVKKEPVFSWEWIRSFLLQPQYSVSFGVIIIGVITGIVFFKQNNFEGKLDKLSTTAIASYLEENIDEIDESALADNLSAEIHLDLYPVPDTDLDEYINNNLIDE